MTDLKPPPPLPRPVDRRSQSPRRRIDDGMPLAAAAVLALVFVAGCAVGAAVLAALL